MTKRSKRLNKARKKAKRVQQAHSADTKWLYRVKDNGTMFLREIDGERLCMFYADSKYGGEKGSMKAAKAHADTVERIVQYCDEVVKRAESADSAWLN